METRICFLEKCIDDIQGTKCMYVRSNIKAGAERTRSGFIIQRCGNC